MSTRRDVDSEDLFADTRMTFGEHLEDLRKHLLRAIYGFLIALCFGLVIGKSVLRIISQPVTEPLRAFYQTHAEQIPQRRDRDPEAQVANRPRRAWRSGPRTCVDPQP